MILMKIPKIESAPCWIRDEIVYENISTPDDYSLILTTEIPGIGYPYEIVIESGDKKASYQFSYDGRGDYDKV